MQWGLVTLFGLLFGSFLNVLILRIPKDESVVFPASHCPTCQHDLKWWHNIPLISWILLGGKCAFCKEKISFQYPLIELLSMLIFFLAYWVNGDVFHSVMTGLVFALLLGLSLIDLRYKAVPDSLNLAALTLAIFASDTIVENFTNALLFAGGFSLLRFYVSFIIKKEALGEADIMIAATIGAMVGVNMGLFTIFLSALIALPVFIYIKERNYEVPFIPFLALALFLVYLFNDFFQELWTLMYG